MRLNLAVPGSSISKRMPQKIIRRLILKRSVLNLNTDENRLLLHCTATWLPCNVRHVFIPGIMIGPYCLSWLRHVFNCASSFNFTEQWDYNDSQVIVYNLELLSFLETFWIVIQRIFDDFQNNIYNLKDSRYQSLLASKFWSDLVWWLKKLKISLAPQRNVKGLSTVPSAFWGKIKSKYLQKTKTVDPNFKKIKLG